MINFGTIRSENGKDYLSLDLEDDEKEENEILKDSKLEDYTILKLLGKGGFGKVFKVRCDLNDKIYAMKKLKLSSSGNEKEEIVKILKENPHPNIVKYYTRFKDKNFLYIIFEYVPNEDLRQYIEVHKKNKTQIKRKELLSIFYQCMKGLYFLHSKKIIHKDIKPDNIFIDNNNTIKLGDFRCAHDIDDITSQKAFTLRYIPYELTIENPINDYKSDVYSMGLTFFELLYLHPCKEVYRLNTIHGVQYKIEYYYDPNDKNKYIDIMKKIR